MDTVLAVKHVKLSLFENITSFFNSRVMRFSLFKIENA